MTANCCHYCEVAGRVIDSTVFCLMKLNVDICLSNNMFCPGVINLVFSVSSYRLIVPEFDQAPCFGVNFVADWTGNIHVGDEILATK